MKNERKSYLVLVQFLQLVPVYLLFKGFPRKFAYCVRVKINKRSFVPFCVWVFSLER